jgi:putative ABC transport system substrate-binding protein
VWPFRGRAQPSTPVIGFLHPGSPNPATAREFRRGLADAGYVEGQNARIEYRWGEGRYERLDSLAADLADRKVDVIVAVSGASARAAKRATTTIPIVFMSGVDPVGDGLVASLAHPGGNITGISFLFGELHPKRLELISELMPYAKSVALLVNPTFVRTEQVVSEVQEAVRAKGIQLHTLKAATEAEIDTAFGAVAALHADALILGSDPFFDGEGERIVALAARHTVATIYPWRDFVDRGGLMSYGPNLTLVSREVGLYTAKILQGAKPINLPVEQPTKFELVINLKAAKALGLDIPASLLAQADEVIE